MRLPSASSRWIPRALWPVAVAYAVSSELVAVRHGVSSTYAGDSTVLAAAELAAGGALMAAGLMTWASRPGDRSGPLAVAAGFAWFAPDWVGWQLGPPVVRSLGLIAAGLVLPLLVHLALARPSGRLPPGSSGRRVTLAVYALAALVAGGRALFYDPFADPDCWRHCEANAFLVAGGAELARALDDLEGGVALTVAAAFTVLAGRRTVAATVPTRRVPEPVLAATAAFAAAAAARAVAATLAAPEDPARGLFALLFVAQCAALGALALALGWRLVRIGRMQSSIARLAAELGDAPAARSLEAMLARSTGDSSLQVAYPRPGGGGYVDADGHPIDLPSADRPRGVTPILRGGERIAVVVHDPAVLDTPALTRAFRPAARLAVENERLRAVTKAQLRDLRASELRIVDAGDAERQRLERDLHDGAQQRLVALSLTVRLALAQAEAGGNAELSARLLRADAELRTLLADLRDLVQGIHPVALADEGLVAAVEGLVEASALPVRLEVAAVERLPATIESAAYAVIAEALRNVLRHAHATHAVVRLGRERDRLLIEVVDDGRGGADASHGAGLTDLADRLGALDGGLALDSPAGEGTRLHAEIPCLGGGPGER